MGGGPLPDKIYGYDPDCVNIEIKFSGSYLLLKSVTNASPGLGHLLVDG